MNDLTDLFVETIAKLGQSVVRVDGRRGYALSGVAYAEDIVVTTSRAAERDEAIGISQDGLTAEASLIGRDPRLDLAVLRVEDVSLTPVSWTSSEALKLGQPVLRLGRPRSLRATFGLLSGLEPEWRTVTGGRMDARLVSDAATFRGFSGGPLVTLPGAVLGLGTAALNRRGDAIIPSSSVKRTVEALLEHGRIRRGYLGVSAQPVRLPPELRENLERRAGLLIMQVAPDSPAAQAGLGMGDTILSLNGEAVRRPGNLIAQLDGELIGQDIAITIIRGGQVKELTVTVGESPG